MSTAVRSAQFTRIRLDQSEQQAQRSSLARAIRPEQTKDRALPHLKRKIPDRYELKHLNNLRTLREFDDQITARYSGFTGADDYYARASASRVAEFIAVPTLVIHSQDDPFIRMLPHTRAKLLSNPNVQLLETEHGGHCAFLAEPNGYDGRWAEQKCIEFLQLHAI